MPAKEQPSAGLQFVRLLLLGLLTLDVLFALYIAYLSYCYNRPVTWVSGSPLNWFKEILIWIGVGGLPKFLLSALKMIDGQRVRLLNDRWASLLAVAITFSLYLLAIYPEPAVRSSGVAGQRLHDEFAELLIPDKISGPLLAAEGYDVSLEIRNRTSVPLFISKVTMKRFSKKGARLFGKSETLVYTGEDHVPWYLARISHFEAI